MSSDAEAILREIPEIRSIVENECWLEGERRGMGVDPCDEIIQNRVAQIILSGVGKQLRHKIQSDSVLP